MKHQVLEAIQAACPETAVIGSSTSGFMPSELQAQSQRPEQILVTHPYNPVYLLPIVECVPSPATSAQIQAQAMATLEQIGMKPVAVGAEVPAHIGDRLMEALWREALWLIKDGVAMT